MTTQEAVPATADLRKYIETRLFGDRPHIRGRRIPVSFIAANNAVNQWGISELAYQFTLSEEEILAALLYYHEHKEEIDRQDAEEVKLWNEMYEQYGKKQEK